MKISITADSTCDLPKRLYASNLHIIPLTVNLGEKAYRETEITPDEMYSFVEATGVLPKTSAVSTGEYQECFERIMKEEESDALIHISLSSEISCTCQNARIAASEMKNIYVVDSLSLSTGSGLLVLSALDKVKEGKDAETIVAELQAEAAHNIQASFVLDKLTYLRKGGRCSALALFGANLLAIKPKIALKEGKLAVDKKYMGRFSSVVTKYVDELLKEYPNVIKKRVFLTYTTIEDETKAEILDRLKKEGFQEIIECVAGGTITAHCGRGTMGVLFMTKN